MVSRADPWSAVNRYDTILVDLGQNSPALGGIYNNKALLLLQLKRYGATTDAFGPIARHDIPTLPIETGPYLNTNLYLPRAKEAYGPKVR